jgi:hypothetical protein
MLRFAGMDPGYKASANILHQIGLPTHPKWALLQIVFMEEGVQENVEKPGNT